MLAVWLLEGGGGAYEHINEPLVQVNYKHIVYFVLAQPTTDAFLLVPEYQLTHEALSSIRVKSSPLSGLRNLIMFIQIDLSQQLKHV